MKLKAALVLCLITLMSGCATYKKSQPLPVQESNVGVVLEPDMPSKWVLPTGVHIDDQSRLVVTGHQKGGGVGMFFGVVGVLAQDSINRSSGKRQFGEAVSELSVDWFEGSELAFNSLMSRNPQTLARFGGQGTELEITPYGIFDVSVSSESQLFTVFDLKLVSESGETWKSSIYAKTPNTYDLESGDADVLMSKIRTDVKQGVEKLCAVTLMQIDQQLEEGSEISAKFPIPYFELKKPIRCKIVGSLDESLVVAPKLPDMVVSSGFHVVRKDELVEYEMD